MSAPAGWYPDSTGTLRWWDGTQWAPVAPAPAAFPAAGTGLVAHGTSANTVWIWLVVLLPLLTVIPTFGYLADLQREMLNMVAGIPLDGSEMDPQVLIDLQMGVFLNPWYLALVVLGLLVYGLGVWFAYLDSRELARRGFAEPFHWAWTFLSTFIYVIGRTVIVRWRGGRALAPLLVLIATQLVMLIAVFVWFSIWMTQFMEALYSTVGSTT